MKMTRTDHEDETTVTIVGKLEEGTAPQFRTLIDELLAANRRHITLDLLELSSIDSSGVGVIVSLHKQVRERGGEVKLVGLTGQPLAFLRLMRLDKVFSM
ncbi:STAS domain-containing protein [Polyangium sorediatum]|uniref:Anti-sigma factor antagonist n=1 Tax=Polyangium sorediatum TaxID=889274 RepID=A0ABT6P8A4_9BACT|nr:STAS domain-containing protein [Polyangium sorediatum]MDI1436851.1 STAS domain-containing protein [Polyangium sorediatum]